MIVPGDSEAATAVVGESRLYAEREAVVDGDLRLIYAQFLERCDRWSSARSWAEACRREAANRDLLDRHSQRLRVATVDDLAWGARPGGILRRRIRAHRVSRRFELISKH